MRAGAKRRVRGFVGVLCLGALTGAAVGSAVGASALLGAPLPGAPLLGAVLGGLSGMISMLTMTAVIAGAEIFLPQTRLGQALERAPFVVTFVTKWLVYGTVILVVLGSRLGRRLALAALLNGDLAQVLDQYVKGTPRAQSIAASFVGTFFFILLLQLSRLVGDRTLRDIVFGRYHRPRTEERFFLFVDIVGSTPLAERLGPAAAHPTPADSRSKRSPFAAVMACATRSRRSCSTPRTRRRPRPPPRSPCSGRTTST